MKNKFFMLIRLDKHISGWAISFVFTIGIFTPPLLLTDAPPSQKGMGLIPGGSFLMGLNELPEGTPWGQENARPKHLRSLPPFYIDR